jgi:hypothetical protein
LKAQGNTPSLPLYGGVTQELVLMKQTGPKPRYNADQVLISMADVFGTRIRRIHLAVPPSPLGLNSSLISKETQRNYSVKRGFGVWQLNETINSMFPGLTPPSEQERL